MYSAHTFCRCPDFEPPSGNRKRRDLGDAGCTPESDILIAQNTYCGLLRDTSGVFGDCIRLHEDMAARHYDVCRLVTCANQDNDDEFKAVACHTVSVFAELCSALGHQEPWRHMAECRKSN